MLKGSFPKKGRDPFFCRSVRFCNTNSCLSYFRALRATPLQHWYSMFSVGAKPDSPISAQRAEKYKIVLHQFRALVFKIFCRYVACYVRSIIQIRVYPIFRALRETPLQHWYSMFSVEAKPDSPISAQRAEKYKIVLHQFRALVFKIFCRYVACYVRSIIQIRVYPIFSGVAGNAPTAT